MSKITPQNAASTVITVTGTATGLYDLIDTAGSLTSGDSETYFEEKNANSLVLRAEDGAVRLGYGITPTASIGEYISPGEKRIIPSVNLKNLELIRAGSANVDVYVEPFTSECGQTEVISMGAGGSSDAPIQVEQKTIAEYEDNDIGVAVTQIKPTSDATYKGTKTKNYSFQTVNVKSSAGTVCWFNAINTTANAIYFQIHNTATTPSASAVPEHSFLVPGNGAITLGILHLGVNGLALTTGIAIANSSDAGIYTAATAGDLQVEIVTV